MTYYTPSAARSSGQKLLIKCITAGMLLFFALFCCSCEKSARPLFYQDNALTADMCGRLCHKSANLSFSFSATLILEAPPERPNHREFSLTFHSPEEFFSVTVSRSGDGELSFSCGGISLSLPSQYPTEIFIKIAEMLDIQEDILKISSISGHSAALSQYERLTEIKTASYTALIDPQTALPVKIELLDDEITVSADTLISYR